MLLSKKHIQAQYLDALNTPSLWEVSIIHGLEPFCFKTSDFGLFKRSLPETIRLGKRVEHFVFNALEQDADIKILSENYQVQAGKQTIGELDALIKYQNTAIHLEIVYKFYVYDSSVGTSEIDHFIGPNRKDSLYEKLEKLSKKQLPLLYRKQTQALLHDLTLDVSAIQQQVCFKAQLFLPYNKTVELDKLNKACVVGYYLRVQELKTFQSSLFYLPTKPDWLLTPHQNVSWLDFDTAMKHIDLALSEKKAICCWVKRNTGELEKCFVVWW